MKDRLLNKFPQHIVPDELSLLSIYEIIMYLTILVGCWMLYRSWNKVPMIEHNVVVEKLQSDFETMAEIRYDLPISTVLCKDKEPARVYADFSVCSKTHDSSSLQNDYVDSLKNFYFAHFPDSLMYRGDLVYFRTEEKIPKAHITNNGVDQESYGYYSYGSARSEKHGKDRELISEVFINSPLLIAQTKYNINMDTPDLTRPSFWSKRDVSQAYFKINLSSQTLDSIRVVINFTGAIDLLPIGVIKPETISGNSVTFALSPKEASDTELFFYAKFRDLENSQSRRVFLLTAVISALITVFIAFLIIFVYRIVLTSKRLITKRISTDAADNNQITT